MRFIMSVRLVSAWAVLVAIPLASACSDDGKPCDPDQIVQDRLCVPAPVVPEAGTEADVEIADGEIIDAVVEAAPPVMGMFGKTCMMAGDSAECAAPAPYCAIAPSATVGYCTAINCKMDPTICPVGWTCFDVSVVNFCLKP
jgi:hypothetical protein